MSTDGIGHADHALVATEVVGHENTVTRRGLFSLFQYGKILAIAGKDRGVGSAETVDALFQVADHKAAVAAHETEDLVLHFVHVLILVYIYLIVLCRQFGRRGRGLSVFVTEQAQHIAAVVGEVANAPCLFFLLHTDVVSLQKIVQDVAHLRGFAHLLRQCGNIF